MEKDPVINFENFPYKDRISGKGELEEIRREVEKEVKEAHTFAKKSADPKESELTKYVFKEAK